MVSRSSVYIYFFNIFNLHSSSVKWNSPSESCRVLELLYTYIPITFRPVYEPFRLKILQSKYYVLTLIFKAFIVILLHVLTWKERRDCLQTFIVANLGFSHIEIK